MAVNQFKRDWKPLLCKETSKWFTGTFKNQPGVYEVDILHQSKILHLTPVSLLNGFNFNDESGFSYTMSMSGMYAFLAALSLGLVKTSDIVYAGWEVPCIQTKRNDGYFIEIYFPQHEEVNEK